MSLKLLKSKWQALLLGGVILGQGMLAFIVGILFFYRGGAYFLDAGYYVYTLASEKVGQQPPVIGDAWGSSLYATHMLLTPLLISQAFRLIASAPMNFIMFLGLQHMILSAAGALLMMVAMHSYGVKKSDLWKSGVFGALLLPFSNVGLGSLLYPHVELIGTSLAAVGILLLTIYWTKKSSRKILFVSVLAIGFGLLAREDIGVHFVITVGSALVCSRWRNDKHLTFIRAGSLLITGIFFVAMLMGYQRVFADSKGVFSLTYSGTPAYAHLTSIWNIRDRVILITTSRLDVTLGMSAFLIAAFVLRKREFLAFPLAVAPWLILNLTAIDTAKNVMGIYHLFPIVLYATAPILAMSLGNSDEASKTQSDQGRFIVLATYGVAVVSLFLGGLSGFSQIPSLFRLSLISPAGITATNSTIEEFAKLGTRITVDDSVMSIRPVDLENIPLIPSIADSSQYDSALFFSTYYLGHAGVQKLLEGWISENRLLTITCLPGGLARVDAGVSRDEKTVQTVKGQFNRALRCHPLPTK